MWLFDLLFGSKQSKAEKVTARSNAMLGSLPDAMDARKDMWQLVDYGPYLHKPTMTRVVHYVANLASDDEATALLLQSRIALDDEIITNPHLRLDAGEHVLYVKGTGFYRFLIE